MSNQVVAVPGYPSAAARHRAEEAYHARHVGMWVFLASDCVLFGGLVGAYWALHGRSVAGPSPSQALAVVPAAVATSLLLASSLTMALAIAFAARARLIHARLWLVVTVLLGSGFLGIQGSEYIGMASHGLALGTNVFAATFYSLTGTHGTHVLTGLLWLVGTLVNSLRRGRLGEEHARAFLLAGLYWHFVDIVWMIIFPVVYLMPFAR